jgi:pimeloyl-ACP methyl ester carboxylesterase
MSTVTLFLHSTGTTPAMWTPFLDIAAPLGTALAPANLGYPPRAPMPRGTPFAVQQDVDAVLSALPADLDALHVIAHSYGGVLAMELLRTLQPKVRSLLLYEPVLFATLMTHGPGTTGADAAADLAACRALAEWSRIDGFLDDDVRGGDARWVERFIDYWNRPGSFARMPEARQADVVAVGWKVYQEVRTVFAHAVDLQPFDALASAGVPVTIAYGERTTREAQAVVRMLAARMPTAQVAPIAGTGHMGPLTHPDLVAPVVAAHVVRAMALAKAG